MRGLVLSSAAGEAELAAGPGRMLGLYKCRVGLRLRYKLWKLLALSSIVSQSRAAVGNKAARVVLQAILGILDLT